ncbi:hypothetical protein [Burkholderia cepacia]|uniref:hypothetical protein n=1 Tax=Burkholderia cepacia TaxID=292 RepID=UPI000AEFD04B|nr:hypothetical protein [Burkholderia cepacia]
MSLSKDNAATRLFVLLSEGKKIPPQTNCREAWRAILSTGDDESLLMTRLGQAMSLAPAAREAMLRHYPTQPAMWNHWFGQVTAAFFRQQLAGTWDTFINAIDPHSMAYLEMNADMLGTREPVSQIAKDTTSDLQEKLASLKSDLLSSDLPEAAKLSVLRHVERLTRALDEYAITGTVPILDAVDSAVGHVMRDPEYRNALQSTDVGEKFINILSVVANVVTVAQGLPQLGDAISAAKHYLTVLAS